MKRRTKMIAAGGLVVLVGSVGAISVSGKDRGREAVRIEAVGTRDLVASVTATGWIRPHRSVNVQADIMGRITELHVKEGDVVQRGQILLRIDPTQYEAAVARAQAGVSEALAREAQSRASLLQAERSFQRARELSAGESSFVSRQQLEEAETQVEVQRELNRAAGHGVAQARAILREAQNALAKTTIRAPMDGVVTRLNVEEGETAIVGTMNNPGSLLLTVSDLARMEAVVRVDETDVPAIKLGDSASVTIDAFPRQSFVGRVTEIAHSSTRPAGSAQSMAAQQQAVDFEIVIALEEPPTLLRPDLSATAKVVTSTRGDALAIPIIALTVREKQVEALPTESPEAAEAAAQATAREREDQEGVFVVRAGKVEFVPVEVGIAGDGFFEVLGGVAAGDSIVAGPYDAIRNLQAGRAVRPLPAAGASDTQKKGAS
jgi:HlyD family secretion protein